MEKPITISLKKFTASVQAAVKAAVAKHPKFKLEAPQRVTISYLIRGIPVPEALLSGLTLSETQAFANDVAGHIAGAHPEAFATAKGGSAAAEGAVLSLGRHVIIGIPPELKTLQIEE